MCCVFYKPLQRVQLCWAKTNFLSETAYFGFSASNFTVQDHVLSTAGDALTTLHFLTAHKMVSSNIVDTATVASVLLLLQSKVSFVAEDYQLTNIAFIEGKRNEL